MISLFPIAVGQYQNTSIISDVEKLFVECKDFFQRSSVDKIDTTIGDYSPGNSVPRIDLRKYNEGRILEKFIKESAQKYLEELQYSKYQIVVENIWLNSMDPGTHSSAHFHYGYAFSGVFYSKCSLTNNKIFFHNPRKDIFYQPPLVEHYNEFNSDTWWIEVNVGDLIIFPSYIKHQANSNLDTLERHSVAFDISLLQER